MHINSSDDQVHLIKIWWTSDQYLQSSTV